MHYLDRLSIGDRVCCAQSLVAFTDGGEAALENLHIERASQTEGSTHDIRRIAWDQLVKEPEPLLRIREGSGAVLRALCDDCLCRASVDASRSLYRRRCLSCGHKHPSFPMRP